MYALVPIFHAIQQAVDCEHEDRVVQLDLSAAFNRVIHAGLIKKMQLSWVDCLALYIFDLVSELPHLP